MIAQIQHYISTKHGYGKYDLAKQDAWTKPQN